MGKQYANMDVSCEVKWNPRVQMGLKKIPDDILFVIAKQTLDLSVPVIPQSNITSHAGTLRRSSVAGGVRGGHGDYYIGSYTVYASYQYRGERADGTHVVRNYTTPGTNNKWFARALKKHSKTIVNNAINQSWRKDMQ